MDLVLEYGSTNVIWCRGAVKGELIVNVADIYGSHKKTDKVHFWALLESLVLKFMNEDICYIGEFNCIRSQDDKAGCVYNNIDMNRFNHFVDSLNLLELEGSNFNFSLFDPQKRRSRLDRILVNDLWISSNQLLG